MFEQRGGDEGAVGASPSVPAAIVEWLSAGVDDRAGDAAARVDRVRVLEEVKAAVCAAQAREVAAFAVEEQARLVARGVSVAEAVRGVAAQVGLARRESPHSARRFTGYARLLVDRLPHTLAALSSGRTTERRAVLVAQHAGWLSVEDVAVVDAEVGPRLESLGDRAVEGEVRRHAARLDPAGVVERQRRAESERRVTLRPAPDTMTYLTALLPVASGVACLARLEAGAAALTAGGDLRSRDQLRADLLVEAITGRGHAAGLESAEPRPADGAAPERRFVPLPAGTDVEIALVMTDRALLGGGDEPAHVQGYGPVPASWVRELLRGTDSTTRVWLRRLFTTPDGSALAGVETRRREFTGALRELVLARDQHCRTPWCGAPIRHVDHVVPHTDGGPTSLHNAQGLCEACNYTKQAPGWQARPGPDPTDPSVEITTPTGHRYTSRAPAPPGRDVDVDVDAGVDPDVGVDAGASPTPGDERLRRELELLDLHMAHLVALAG